VRTQWESLYQSFDLRIRRADSVAFGREAAAHDALSAFVDLGDLLAYVLERPSDLDVRDQVIAALLCLARDDRTREVASALVWLTLWPGLCGIYRRARRRGASEGEALSAIGFALTSQIQTIDLSRVNRVVATIVRNTERDSISVLRPRSGEDVFDEDVHPARQCDPTESIGYVWHRLAAVAGRDAELVLRVVVLEESHPEVAESFGISAAAARKRFQRALDRARVGLAEEVAA